MYALIYKGGMFLGVFSSKKTMRIVIEALIQDQYESNGYHGDYHFQYVKFNPLFVCVLNDKVLFLHRIFIEKKI